jgi:hypothetical protein
MQNELNLLRRHKFVHTVKPVLMTTSEQCPTVNKDQSEFPTQLNLL